jgi:subtilisin family serine protease
MKTIFFSLLMFALFNCELFGYEYEQNKLVIKVSEDFYRNFNNIKDLSGGIESLKQTIGEHKISHYVDGKLLLNLEKRNSGNQLQSKKNQFGLERIFLIEYSKNIDPILAAGKLKSQKFIEYAEPLFIRKTCELEIPNDTLFSRQYYLNSIKALESWSQIDTAGKKVVIGVVDTGVDYLHEDLVGNTYINPGEDGPDSTGAEKRTNGLDDDDNGFVDDWMGWDFGSDSLAGYDNNPLPGNGHGTHVAGIIAATKNNITGIAGIGLNVKILPVKIAGDSPNARSLTKSYDGMLYAAIAGANVINCSWGGGGYAQAEQDIVHQVLALGTVIVAAAGNDYSNTAFFPASYDGIVSVAAIDSSDRKAGFSNYNTTVDVSAPGVAIMSTVPPNDYASWDGTSMASPVAAAVASMVWLNYPEYISIQVGEHIKATTENISSKNPFYSGVMGTGKVNAFKASTEKNPVSLILKSYTVKEEIEDGVIKSGERIDISLELFNALKPVSNVKIYAVSLTQFLPEYINDKLDAGDFRTLETKSIPGTISLIVPDSVGLNYNLPITINLIDDKNNRFTSTITVFVNPTWRTMKQNNIHITFTSQGNLAYDDFPNNNRGLGFKYKNSSNMLFEGALMVAYGSRRLSNVARGSSGSASNRDFAIIKPIETYNPGKIANEETLTEYRTKTDSLSLADTTIAPVKVIQTGYQFVGNNKDNFIIANYDIINITDEFQDSVFAALYMDWDLGASGSNNRAIWNKSKEYAYIINAVNPIIPLAGIKLLSNQNVNFWAIDNDGDTDENPGVYDGFTKQEKLRMMSGGIGRDSSSATDCSVVFGAGPIRLRAGDTTRVSIALFAGNSLQELDKIADEYLPAIQNLINPNGNFASFPKKSNIQLVYPNPGSNNIIVEISVSEINSGEISIWDINGKKVKTLYNYNISKSNKLYPGFLRLEFNISDLSQGQYFIRFATDNGTDSKILNVMR